MASKVWITALARPSAGAQAVAPPLRCRGRSLLLPRTLLAPPLEQSLALLSIPPWQRAVCPSWLRFPNPSDHPVPLSLQHPEPMQSYSWAATCPSSVSSCPEKQGRENTWAEVDLQLSVTVEKARPPCGPQRRLSDLTGVTSSPASLRCVLQSPQGRSHGSVTKQGRVFCFSPLL